MNAGLHAVTEGFASYRRSAAGLLAARRLGENVSIGLRFNYSTLRIAGYGRAAAVTGDISGLFHITPHLHFNLQLNNPAGNGMSGSLPVPSIYVAGLAYESSDAFWLSAEVVKEQSHGADARFCIQYKPGPEMLLRTIIQSRDPSCWLGAGLLKGRFRMDVYTSYHLTLGAGMGLVLSWRSGRDEQKNKERGK